MIRRAQDDVRWADHIVILYPLWLGDMPALRPGFALNTRPDGTANKLQGGKNAPIVVTKGMSAFFYRGITAPTA